MEWFGVLVAVAVVLAFLGLKRVGLVRADAARAYLAQGAKVIDVRSAEEYESRHLPEALNIPLEELSMRVPALVPDKQQPLLLHCLSGVRSGIAKRRLRRLGYLRAFNLGSYGRAERIMRRSGG